MREWLTVIISLLIVGIFLDGLRRMRRARRESLRMSRNVRRFDNEDLPEPGYDTFSEPRVVSQRDTRDAENITKSVRESFAKSRVTVGAPRRIPEQVALNLEESVPMLMDSVENTKSQENENSWEEDEDWTPDHSYSEASDDEAFDDNERDRELDEAELDGQKPDDRDQAVYEELEPSLGSMDDLTDSPPPASSPSAKTATSAEGKSDRVRPARNKSEPDEVLIMNLMAPAGKRFEGAELLQALLDQGLRFGSMNIFHRHKNADGSGPVQFSLANMVVPGTFDLAAMPEFSTPGLSMFLSLPNEDDSLAAFDNMAETAKALAEQLGGELKDENRSVMTRQTIEHCRQRVIEFERKQRLMHSNH